MFSSACAAIHVPSLSQAAQSLPSLPQLGPAGLAPVQAGECQFHYVGAANALPAGERQAMEQAVRAVFGALQQQAQAQGAGFGKHVLVSAKGGARAYKTLSTRKMKALLAAY